MRAVFRISPAWLYRDRDCTYPAQVAELCQLFSSRLTALDNDAIFTASIKQKHRTKRVIKHVEFPHAEEVPLACFTFLISVILIVNHQFNVLWITCTFEISLCVFGLEHVPWSVFSCALLHVNTWYKAEEKKDTFLVRGSGGYREVGHFIVNIVSLRSWAVPIRKWRVQPNNCPRSNSSVTFWAWDKTRQTKLVRVREPSRWH